ncbi:MAG: hypothetical protein Q7T76_20695 [Ferruginibacter sp.]|nr:hypothetical protein [Ferruginibacter sp.]
MDLTPFTVYYQYHDKWESSEIRPCCREDNVVDYAIWKEDKLAFTITKVKTEPAHHWVIAVKNADDSIEDELVQILGAEIDRNHKPGNA